MREVVAILDFCGQYNQLIARRVRECNVFCEILPFNTSADRLREIDPKGIIFTGGPASVYENGAPRCDEGIFELGIPVLGICYGMQLMTYVLGGEVRHAEKREFGEVDTRINNESSLFKGLDATNVCLMSHMDYVDRVPDGFDVIASTDNCNVAGMENVDKGFYGIQFHPEVNHTENGTKIIRNFLYNVCRCSGDWRMDSFVDESVRLLKNKMGNKRAVCALSGGVDSSVAAAIVNKAIGDNLTCIFVDHGLLRKNEADEVEKIFTEKFDVNFIRVDASDRFLSRLAGVEDPELKRKIIGEEFIRGFEEEGKKLGKVDFLVQGTIYPDVIESGVRRWC